MSIFKSVSILTGLAIFLLLGCNKGEERIAPVDPQEDFAARIAGVKWVAKNYEAMMDSGKITLSGMSDDGRVLAMEISGDTVGTYPVNENSSSLAFYGEPGKDSIYTFYTSEVPEVGDFVGAISLTKVNRQNQTISGNFKLMLVKIENDTVRNYQVIDNGVFNSIGYEVK